MNDMSFLILGYDHREGIVFPLLDRGAGFPFNSTGFGSLYGDPDINNNQVNHFWFFVHVGYQLGFGPASESVLLWLAEAHENPDIPLIGAAMGGGSEADLRPSQFGIFLGMQLRSGRIQPGDVDRFLQFALRLNEH